MKAFAIEAYNQDTKFIDQTKPQINDEEVLIEIHAASINPLDSKIWKGELKALLEYDLPLVLGNDFSGTVVEKGKNVTKFNIGDEVYGKPRSEKMGTFTEYIALNEAEIALKPTNLSFEEAAGIPLVGLTSYQVFNDILNLNKDDKILIHAGSGGVGTFAIQLAKSMGAYVATTSSDGIDLAKSMRADQVINYKTENFDDIIQDFDAVLDTIGGDALEKSFKSVKKGGDIISIAGPPNEAFAEKMGFGFVKRKIFSTISRKVTNLEKEYGVDYMFYFMEHNGKQLETLTKLLEEGTVKSVIDRVYPFEEAEDALNYSETGKAKGKIILKMK